MSPEDEPRDSLPSYWSLTRSQRDHLTATHTHPETPNGIQVCTQVQDLRGGERPSNKTTYSALDALTDMGLLAKHDVDGKQSAYRVTDAGRQVLDGVVRALQGGESDE